MTHYECIINEFDEYYSNFDDAGKVLYEGLDKLIKEHKNESSYVKKTLMHEFLCENTPIHVFEHTPFLFEISSGRGRFSWGGIQSEVGSYMHKSTAEKWLNPYGDALKPDRDEGFMSGWNNPVGLDHHCPGYDNLFELGFNGIIRKAEEAMENCIDSRKREYYSCVIRSNRALLTLLNRFKDAKKTLKTSKTDVKFLPSDPGEPPKTFYEALNLILFYREVVGSIEGLGISIFGQLDRLLYPYYKADLESGRMTREEAKQLIDDLLIYTNVRFDCFNTFRETSTTLELGGCDRDGNMVCNELTYMILQSVIDVRSVNTKINCRVSKDHPTEYIEKIMEVQLENLPCVMMHNDDVLIPARVKLGQDIEDARLYVGGGCHEIVLANTEMCTRADTWINLPRIFLETIKRDYNTFDELYSAFIADVKAYHEHIVKIKNEGESHWCEISPLPLLSSTLTGYLESGRDATEGGVKYPTTALSMLGTATLVDSIYAVKRLVFDDKKLSLADFVKILNENYENNEQLRQYIINSLPKYGTNNEVLDELSSKVLADISTVSGQTNARGGKYLPAFYPHDLYVDLGKKTGATPDGRLAETSLSRGASPSEFIDTDSPLDIIGSLRSIDFTNYADSFITEITLPRLEKNEQNLQILTAIVKAFIEAGGSSLQFNLMDRELLIEAKKNPEAHKNLIVRVCGYSAVFVYLKEFMQDEVIKRAVR